ncbi:MAG: Crp/Fnr family transcriptional regulator [Chitinophagaceae bacterium]|nr:Crp/Fnr family transcriptional regulator [Chitinophagaceae bacterium]
MFTKILDDYIAVEDSIKAEINELTEEICFEKGELILKQGETSRHLYYMEQGLIRAYSWKNEKEITTWFSNEGSLVTSAYSFISEKPAFESIVAVENCKMHALTRKQLYALYDKYPSLNEMGRKLIEIYFLELEERINAIHFQTARQRYDTFIKNESYLLQKVTLGNIASYLGMTQETLSRIRNLPSKPHRFPV